MENFELNFGRQEYGEQLEDLLEQSTPSRKRPSMYSVMLLNDDKTPVDFIVDVVKRIFHKDSNSTAEILVQIHTQGRGHCGVFTRDVAETKMVQVIEYARTSCFPLKCIMRKNDT